MEVFDEKKISSTREFQKPFRFLFHEHHPPPDSPSIAQRTNFSQRTVRISTYVRSCVTSSVDSPIDASTASIREYVRDGTRPKFTRLDGIATTSFQPRFHREIHNTYFLRVVSLVTLNKYGVVASNSLRSVSGCRDAARLINPIPREWRFRRDPPRIYSRAR